MIYITGDTHREFSRLDNFNYQKKDILIILGDAGINYFLNHFDDVVKERLNKLGLIFFALMVTTKKEQKILKLIRKLIFLMELLTLKINTQI